MGKGRAPCCDKSKVKRGPWSPEEDLRLISFIRQHGHANWRSLPAQAGLLRCGKSCRLRWINYLRPDVKRGNITTEEEETIIKLHQAHGNKWSKIASYMPGRTDNEIKNVWNTHIKKRLIMCTEVHQLKLEEEEDDDKKKKKKKKKMMKKKYNNNKKKSVGNSNLPLSPSSSSLSSSSIDHSTDNQNDLIIDNSSAAILTIKSSSGTNAEPHPHNKENPIILSRTTTTTNNNNNDYDQKEAAPQMMIMSPSISSVSNNSSVGAQQAQMETSGDFQLQLIESNSFSQQPAVQVPAKEEEEEFNMNNIIPSIDPFSLNDFWNNNATSTQDMLDDNILQGGGIIDEDYAFHFNADLLLNTAYDTTTTTTTTAAAAAGLMNYGTTAGTVNTCATDHQLRDWFRYLEIELGLVDDCGI